MFLANFGSLSTYWWLFTYHHLLEGCCWPCPSLYDHSVSSSHSTHWLLGHDNEFTGLRWSPQSLDLSPEEHLRWNTRFISWICSNILMLFCQFGQNPLKNVPSTLLNKLWGGSEARSLKSCSKMYLIKPVRVAHWQHQKKHQHLYKNYSPWKVVQVGSEVSV